MLLDIQGDMNAIKNTMNELKKLSDEEKINLPKDVYLRNIFCSDCSLKKTCGETPCENYEYWEEGYEKGLAALEKENAKLKAQIEKMKNCQNCKHCKIVYDEETQTIHSCIYKETECKWELAE